MRKRKFWGWDYEDELLSDEEENNIDNRIASTFNLDSVAKTCAPTDFNFSIASDNAVGSTESI